MIKNSIGNITDILTLLDEDKWSGEQLRENYLALIEKWGEWEIIGQGEAGLVVRYVNIGNALFSGLALTFATLTVIFLTAAIILGKIIFPLLSKHFESVNAVLVDVATLRSAEQINDIHKKEWF